jgi:putative ABC transport system ATP-binding protein
VVHQTFHLLPGYTTRENIELAMRFGAGLDRARASALLRRVGLEARESDLAGHLSTGQMQRVAVARALANQPLLVLADEPSASLDPRAARDAMELLRESCRESHAALLVVSHDERAVSEFARVERMDALSALGAER